MNEDAYTAGRMFAERGYERKNPFHVMKRAFYAGYDEGPKLDRICDKPWGRPAVPDPRKETKRSIDWRILNVRVALRKVKTCFSSRSDKS